MKVQPKDTVIVDKGLPSEEVAVVYMTGETIAACASILDGADKFLVPMDRLTKLDENDNPLT